MVTCPPVKQAWFDPRLAALRHRLAPHAPGGAGAGVAVLLRPVPGDLEVLLIIRAERTGDPWSGHVALPGGRRDAHDPDDLATAIRETREEVGIDLGRRGMLLGGLQPVHPRSNPAEMLVAPWVFGVPGDTTAIPNHEVQAAAWIGLATLADPAARAKHRYVFPDGTARSFPARRVSGLTVWGMTLRVVTELLEIADCLPD